MKKHLFMAGLPLLLAAPSTAIACDLDGYGGMHRFAAFAALQAQAQQDSEALPRPDRRSMPYAAPQTEQLDSVDPNQPPPADSAADGQPLPENIRDLATRS